MVLTSTIHVAPHICGYIWSIVIYLVQVELQMVLISTVSIFFLSSLSSSFSCLNLVHEDPARSLRLRPLPCKQQQPHSESCKGGNKQFLRAAAGSTGLLRAARGGERASGVAQDAAGEREDGAALASPPFPSSCAPATTDGQGVSGRDMMILQHSRPDRTACCARQGRGRRRRRPRAAAAEATKGEKQIDFAALKNTG